MESFTNKNFYKNIYFRKSSQVIHISMGWTFSLLKFFIKIFILKKSQEIQFSMGWTLSLIKYFIKIFILEIWVEWYISVWMNSVSNKIFYKNIYLRNSIQVNHPSMRCNLSLIKIFTKIIILEKHTKWFKSAWDVIYHW